MESPTGGTSVLGYISQCKHNAMDFCSNEAPFTIFHGPRKLKGFEYWKQKDADSDVPAFMA